MGEHLEEGAPGYGDAATAPVERPVGPELVRGALELERTAHGRLPHRLPARARAQIPDEQLAMAEAQRSRC